MSEDPQNEHLASLRREYTMNGLDEADMDADPINQFDVWINNALEAKLIDANGLTLATADTKGRPSARTVLLKHFDHKGFVFYTNYTSRKAEEMDANPWVSLLFYWREFERQIRIEGKAEKITRKESTYYFKQRPRDSRIGAWVSNQSSVINTRAMLRKKFNEMKRKFSNKEIPLPDHWGGYRVVPEEFEFWQGRANRLHDRLLYTKVSEGEDRESVEWEISRLAP